jgi:hypothetical protein
MYLRVIANTLSRAHRWAQQAAHIVTAVGTLVDSTATVVEQLRAALGVASRRTPPCSYETEWLRLVLDIRDTTGARAILRRSQRVRFLVRGATVVRELVWGNGKQLENYRARGMRRLGLTVEGSKSAVLLAPISPPEVGDALTVTSRRTIRGAFRDRQGYCEAFLERPTRSLTLTILFPTRRPPRVARLVLAPTERVLRTVPVHVGAQGRPVLRCRIPNPRVACTYSLRWRW